MLGALAGTLLAGAKARAEPFRLDRVGVVRFSEVIALPAATDAPPAQIWVQNGVLDVDGRVTPRSSSLVARPANLPAWAVNRDLISEGAWSSYRRPGATANFQLTEGAISFKIGEVGYHSIAPSPDAIKATGSLINLSTRARLAAGDDVVIADFVIEGREWLVLVRVVGPGLAQHGVADAAPDPVLKISNGRQTLYANDNWSADASADAVRLASARIGAFPLAEGSKDAARLVRLTAGVSTAIAQAAPNRAGGTVLIEIYGVPEDPEYAL